MALQGEGIYVYLEQALLMDISCNDTQSQIIVQNSDESMLMPSTALNDFPSDLSENKIKCSHHMVQYNLKFETALKWWN